MGVKVTATLSEWMEEVQKLADGTNATLKLLVARLDALCKSVDLKAQLAESQSELNDTRADRVMALAAHLDDLQLLVKVMEEDVAEDITALQQRLKALEQEVAKLMDTVNFAA